MGCHTWIYKKCSALTETEKSDIEAEALKDAEGWWGFSYQRDKFVERLKQLYENLTSKYDDYDPFHGQTPEQHADDLIKKYTLKRDRIKAEGLPAVIEYEKNSAHVHFEGDEPYYHIGGDELLRVREIPDDSFSDAFSLLNWLKSHDSDKIGYYDAKCVWQFGYTPELEKRINEYFTKHGENNLYVEFG